MAFLDKITSVTKNAAAGAGDMIEITKLNAKISGENKKIEGLKYQLGELYWQKACDGQELDADAMSIVYQMQEIQSQINAYNQEIADIKAAAPQAAAQAASGAVCANCGAAVPPGSRFCANCGTAVPQEKTCANCGAKIDPTGKFCANCGAPLE